LAKASATDFDTEWVNQSGGGGGDPLGPLNIDSAQGVWDSVDEVSYVVLDDDNFGSALNNTLVAVLPDFANAENGNVGVVLSEGLGDVGDRFEVTGAFDSFFLLGDDSGNVFVAVTDGYLPAAPQLAKLTVTKMQNDVGDEQWLVSGGQLVEDT
jgi:hypothetical protein